LVTFGDNLPKYEPYGNIYLDFKIIKGKNILGNSDKEQRVVRWKLRNSAVTGIFEASEMHATRKSR
jgi:hypothetical protein